MRRILMLMLCLAAVTATAQQDEKVKEVAPEVFQEAMKASDDAVLIDLRTPEELKGGMIPGAIHIDFFGPRFEAELETLQKDKSYFLYCASGARSGETATLLSKRGFKDVYNLEGGFRGWVRKKMPVNPRR